VRQRPGDQPLPVPNDNPSVQDAVIADMEARKVLGLSRYGTLLQPLNGRDALRDLYEELLDAAMYAKQCLMERDALCDNCGCPVLPGHPHNAETLGRCWIS